MKITQILLHAIIALNLCSCAVVLQNKSNYENGQQTTISGEVVQLKKVFDYSLKKYTDRVDLIVKTDFKEFRGDDLSKMPKPIFVKVSNISSLGLDLSQGTFLTISGKIEKEKGWEHKQINGNEIGGYFDSLKSPSWTGEFLAKNKSAIKTKEKQIQLQKQAELQRKQRERQERIAKIKKLRSQESSSFTTCDKLLKKYRKEYSKGHAMALANGGRGHRSIDKQMSKANSYLYQFGSQRCERFYWNNEQ